ncbi:MAG: restriction endonuclease subunit S, partial [bacterium]|nr:restriction endonuclease subunit S [bacterium]
WPFDEKIENNSRIIKTLEEMAQAVFKEWFVKFRFPGYKKVEFVDSELGKIPKGWKIGKIKDIVSVISGYPFSSKLYNAKLGLGVVTIKNVQDGKFIIDCNTFIKEEKLPSNLNPECRLKDGDIVLSLTGNVGRVCFVYGGEYLLNQRVAKLIPKRSSDFAYCYFLFRQGAMQNYMINMAKGSAQPNLSPVEIAETSLVLSSSDVLDAFSEIARSIYERILNNSNENQKLAVMRDLLLPRLMSGEIKT